MIEKNTKELIIYLNVEGIAIYIKIIGKMLNKSRILSLYYYYFIKNMIIQYY